MHLLFVTSLVPDGDPLFVHRSEGPDDMPAHVKAMLTLTSLSIPVRRGQLVLGVWQAVYLIEHRDRPHERAIEAIYQGTMQNDVNR